MTTALKIAMLRAKMVAKSNARRAAEILIAAGVTLQSAVHYVLSVLRFAQVVA